MRGQASLELLVGMLIMLLCIGAIANALQEANERGGKACAYWEEKMVLGKQALLAQEFAASAGNAQEQMQWGEWKANGFVMSSVRNNASVRSAVRIQSGAGTRQVEKNALQGT